MRLRVNHKTRYVYDGPVRNVVQALRLTPAMHDSQYVRHWRVEVDRDVRLYRSTDALGNAVHHLTIEGPIEDLTIEAFGEVEVHDTSGVMAGTRETLPRGVFLRETDLTAPDDAVRALSPDPAEAQSDALSALHALTARIRDAMLFEVGATTAATSGAQALAQGRGVCQDFSHVFIAAARLAGIPARYISGHLHQDEHEGAQEAGHAWAEAHVEDLGWVGFDPANGIAVTDHYVRVAVGFDALSGSAVRGAYAGGAGERLEVTVDVDPAGRAAQPKPQSQTQQ